MSFILKEYAEHRETYGLKCNNRFAFRRHGELAGWSRTKQQLSYNDNNVGNSLLWNLWLQSLGWEPALEKERANPLQYSCLENPINRGVWWATVHGISRGRQDSVQFSGSAVSNSLRPHGLQQARPPCPSPTPGVYWNSCPLSRWCHPTISSHPHLTTIYQSPEYRILH